jgi:YidC/Oxa1 family membrane protein insertase
MENNKNILLATTLSAVVLLSWTWFYEKPRIEKQEEQKRITQQQIVKEVAENKPQVAEGSPDLKIEQKINEVAVSLKTREEILSQSESNRVKVESENLHGSISLIGARFDDLTLAQYFTDTKKTDEVILFAPSASKERYFADFGWISSDKSLQLPTPETLWKSSSAKLTPQNPITLTWKNSQNIEFLIKISLDENYMFNLSQEVKNNSGKDITVASYGRINRALPIVQKSTYILHEGPIGVFSDILHEVNYETFLEEKSQEFANEIGGWFGITDKYWFSSILPDKGLKYSASFSYDSANKNNLFNTEFVGQEFKIAAAEKLEFNHHLFAGAKKVALLDQYAKEYDAKLFDRAIDFGWFYFLTKPFFFAISYLSKLLGNFGLAILAMTVFVKLALFPMANKSFGAIAKVKKLQPKIEDIKKKFKDDKMAMNREVMELYKREKVNPASGCLPILIQIPIFFSLYKVFYVTLDMRHAPFYGWIKDLSAPDPTSIFNLFGLLPFEVSPAFVIGIWPILMGVTMIIQQKLSPMSTDPVQQKVMKWMPYGLTFVLAAFPAGLVIYWTWSNTLSILQQWLIAKKLNKEK